MYKRQELLARLAGGMAAPLREFASLLNAIPQNFAYALSALIEAGGAGTGTDEATEAVSDDEATEAVPDDEAPSQDAEEETSESVDSSESGTDEEESVENNKIDGDANENEES